ncbi:MAG: Transcriptional regulator, PaaX family [Berkelbacteria bacterium GW2011_GWA1_39_10]|uniref:Transcriptional regulator, PaaX family n=1 Tax=Berkelbacteria bacterium GW2011_GWA1_39_10 TaxID=1618332 RepID=A0A0G0LSA3_9BACT|nr:MAG: Transcriptional regulator, PaaX family [Berkelbacteria bacterium GW2011_GWA1_39_10]
MLEQNKWYNDTDTMHKISQSKSKLNSELEPEELKNIELKKTEIVARQILLYFFDFYRTVTPLFDKARFYRIPFKEYDKFRENDKIRFSHEFYRLRRAGFIKKYFDGKEYQIELLPKGQKLLKRHITQDLEIHFPEKWDKKWRIVIFDIPNDKKVKREILRTKLESLGFLKLQESVYVFPFDCLAEIQLLKNLCFIEPYVQYMVVERIETEINLMKKFYDLGILEEKMM